MAITNPIIPKKSSTLFAGKIIDSGNFTLVKRIENIQEFWTVINTEKSLYAGHRMYPTAFFFSWPIKLINSWMVAGCFWTTKPED